MKVKLIDVLNMVEDKTLKDDERVIIDSSLYYYNEKDKKFYTVPKSEEQDTYRHIYTAKLDLECELIDRNVKEIDLTVPTEEIDIQQDSKCFNYFIQNKNGTKCYLSSHSKIMSDKINELVREVNRLKGNDLC